MNFQESSLPYSYVSLFFKRNMKLQHSLQARGSYTNNYHGSHHSEERGTCPEVIH